MPFSQTNNNNSATQCSSANKLDVVNDYEFESLKREYRIEDASSHYSGIIGENNNIRYNTNYGVVMTDECFILYQKLKMKKDDLHSIMFKLEKMSAAGLGKEIESSPSITIPRGNGEENFKVVVSRNNDTDGTTGTEEDKGDIFKTELTTTIITGPKNQEIVEGRQKRNRIFGGCVKIQVDKVLRTETTHSQFLSELEKLQNAGQCSLKSTLKKIKRAGQSQKTRPKAVVAKSLEVDFYPLSVLYLQIQKKDGRDVPFYRYVINDFSYVNPSTGTLNSKVLFFTWLPDNAPIKDRMLYISNKNAIMKGLSGISIELQHTKLCDYEYENILKTVLSKR